MAGSKAEATERMYDLAGEPREALGPGSKEKRSALEALGRAIGLSLDGIPTKVECSRRIAMRVDVAWDSSCYSAGDSITLVGLNRLLHGVERSLHREDDGYTVGLAFDEETDPNLQTEQTDLEHRVAEGIAELTRPAETPVGFTSVASPIRPSSIRFDDGSWRTHLQSVSDWLHLASDLDGRSATAFDASLARGLALDESWAAAARDPLHEVLLPRLADRIDRALALRENFEEQLETAVEGGATRDSATAGWSDAWEEVEEEEEVEGSGPIHAEADTWPIQEFVGLAREMELNLSPSYQRADVWPTSSSQLLIESILRGIPLPSIIILERDDEGGTRYEVVDGKQRLTSILRFIGMHPGAVEVVKRKAEEWGIPGLLDIYQDDYIQFKRLWKKNEVTRLTAQAERLMYFPFQLRTGEIKPLSGELAPFRGKYYFQIKDQKLTVLGQTRNVKYVFERAASYKLPVIIYKQVTSEQIHEVFSLYNKQGKHLNAEEIRNALYHHLAFMKALVVTAGDSGAVETDAPFLEDQWADLVSTQKVLDSYGFGQAGYKRTKLLSWVSAALLLEDGPPERRSTANHVNALLKRIDEDKSDPLRDVRKARDAVVLLDKGLDAHAAIPPEVWAKQFVNSRSSGKWQELQLVASLISLCAAFEYHGGKLTGVLEDKWDAISTASASWTRPRKTQSREQWQFIAKVVSDLLGVLDVPIDATDARIRARFGASGLRDLVGLWQS